MGRFRRREIEAAIESLAYRDEAESRAFLALWAASRLPITYLLSLKSTDLILRGRYIILHKDNKIIRIKKKDPLTSIAWKHIRTIPPYCYLFENLISKGSKIDSKIRYYFKKWFPIRYF